MTRFIAVFFAVLSGTGCQHASETDKLAVLADDSAETLAMVERELLHAIEKPGWSLDTTAISTSSIMTLRPPKPDPLNTRNPNVPLKLELKYREGACFAVRADTDEEIPLPDVRCKPA